MRHRILLAAAAALLTGPALALDAPHDASASPGITCTLCHVGHNAPGATLTSVYGNPNLCFSCHNQPNVGTRLGFPWTPGDQAVPGAGGRSHRWDAAVTSPEHGARAPLSADLARNLDAGGLTCSVCHDPHGKALQFARGAAQHVFTASGKLSTGSVLTRTAGAGTGTLTLASVAAPTATRSGARPRAYRVRIDSGGAAGSATFVVSYDNGRSWSTPASTASTAVLDTDEGGAAVTVTFAGNFVAADEWKPFTVAYPFLRASNLDSALCEDCHRDRVQTAACVEGSPGATTGAGESCDTSSGIAYSHPAGAGVTLQRAYDRVSGGVPQPLDVNGATQGHAGGDPLATNKLTFDASNQVRCLTCHAPHNADSNSLSEDLR